MVQPDTGPPPSSTLPRKEWVKLNRRRTRVGRFNGNMFRWGLVKSPFYHCGSELQTVEHRTPHLSLPNPPTSKWQRGALST